MQIETRRVARFNQWRVRDGSSSPFRASKLDPHDHTRHDLAGAYCSAVVHGKLLCPTLLYLVAIVAARVRFVKRYSCLI